MPARRRRRGLRLPTSLLLGALLAATAGCGEDASSGAPPSGPSPGGAPDAPRARILVVTHTTGFRHDSIATAETVLAALGAGAGRFDVTFGRTAADVAERMTPSALAGIDAVIFANTTGNPGVPDLPAFLDWIRGGRGFLGVHSASDTYHDEPAYLEMLGGEFATHGNQTTVDLVVEQPSHPAVASLPNPWRVFDEIYEFRANPRATSSVLLSLPAHPQDGHAGAGTPGDFPIAWFRAHGTGRVVYTALGHRDDVWTGATFQAHLRGAIDWVLGR